MKERQIIELVYIGIMVVALIVFAVVMVALRIQFGEWFAPLGVK